MANPMVRFHNTETGEIIDREMTDIEYADYLADCAASLAALKESAK